MDYEREQRKQIMLYVGFRNFVEWVRESGAGEVSVSQPWSITDIFCTIVERNMRFVKRNEDLKTHNKKSGKHFLE